MKPAPPGRGLRPVPPGGRVRIVSIAGRVPAEPFERGVARLRARGYEVTLPRAALSGAHEYLAAGTSERLDDFLDALTDPSQDAVICARGGYGALHLLRDAMRRMPESLERPFVGFSDITCLHLAMNARGWQTLHGPVVTALGRDGEGQALVDRLSAALEGRLPARERIAGTRSWGVGAARGPLVGGNLSLLSVTLPVPGCAPPPGAILLVEEVNEAPYRVDRLLTGLVLSGALDAVAGVALGSFRGCGSDEGATAALAAECLRPLGVPVVAGLPIGHGPADLTVPLGASATLDAGDASLTVSWDHHGR